MQTRKTRLAVQFDNLLVESMRVLKRHTQTVPFPYDAMDLYTRAMSDPNNGSWADTLLKLAPPYDWSPSNKDMHKVFLHNLSNTIKFSNGATFSVHHADPQYLGSFNFEVTFDRLVPLNKNANLILLCKDDEWETLLRWHTKAMVVDQQITTASMAIHTFCTGMYSKGSLSNAYAKWPTLFDLCKPDLVPKQKAAKVSAPTKKEKATMNEVNKLLLAAVMLTDKDVNIWV